MQTFIQTSNKLTASAEVAAKAVSLNYSGRLAFWFYFFLRRESKLAKEASGLIKPYFPKVRAAKSQLLLTGPAPLPAPPSEIVIS